MLLRWIRINPHSCLSSSTRTKVGMKEPNWGLIHNRPRRDRGARAPVGVLSAHALNQLVSAERGRPSPVPASGTSVKPWLDKEAQLEDF